MRALLVATLALAPAMIHAQATSPAQQASLKMPASFATTSAAIPTSPVRVSTGVVAPKLTKTIDVAVAPNTVWMAEDVESRKVKVAMLVDASGVPSELKVVESAGPELDKDVLAAVAQYRFTPGSVSNVPYAVPVNLEVIVRSPYTR